MPSGQSSAHLQVYKPFWDFCIWKKHCHQWFSDLSEAQVLLFRKNKKPLPQSLSPNSVSWFPSVLYNGRMLSFLFFWLPLGDRLSPVSYRSQIFPLKSLYIYYFFKFNRPQITAFPITLRSNPFQIIWKNYFSKSSVSRKSSSFYFHKTSGNSTAFWNWQPSNACFPTTRHPAGRVTPCTFPLFRKHLSPI